MKSEPYYLIQINPYMKYVSIKEKIHPTTEDGNNLIVSPTSSGVCPEGFNLDYASGLCHTPCEKGTFYGTKSGSKVTGCR
jgi:hypothetical protein